LLTKFTHTSLFLIFVHITFSNFKEVIWYYWIFLTTPNLLVSSVFVKIKNCLLCIFPVCSVFLLLITYLLISSFSKFR
jgi:hypothetical protein